jgi:hypothetical protein
MHDPNASVVRAEPGLDLQNAARIRRHDRLGARREHVANLSV